MRKSLLATTSVAGLSLCAAFAANAATIVTVPMVTGAVSQTVFGINDSNIIAGSFKDSAGIEHGFFGPVDGSNYTTFDIVGDGTTGTEPRAISRDGSIAGFLPGSGFAIGEEFFRRPGGSIAFPQFAGKRLDGVLQGTNFLHISMGDYYNADGIRAGYRAQNGHWQYAFNLRIEGWTQNSPRKITDDERTVAGYFIDADGGEHGFIQKHGVAQVIDYPGNAILTVLEDINNRGRASGQWDDSSGNPHAFSLDTKTNTFTDIKIKDGSTFQQSWGINDYGLIPVSTSTGVSYIYCPHTASKCPGGGTEAKMPTIHVAAGTFLKHDAYGRTGRKLPPAGSIKTHGMIQ